MTGGDDRIAAGMLAVSRAGHDRGRTYVIVRADSRFVWLADGRLKKVSGPKKKSRKHIQAIRREGFTLPASAADEAVKRVLKEYLAERNQEDWNVENGRN